MTSDEHSKAIHSMVQNRKGPAKVRIKFEVPQDIHRKQKGVVMPPGATRLRATGAEGPDEG